MKAVVLPVVLAFVAVLAGCGGAASRHVEAAGSQSGCVFHDSLYGYPQSFLTRGLPYTKHPPLPKSGWYDASAPLSFPVLFHSIFHGYVVVRYRTDLPSRTRGLLRTWVVAHEAERVAATPAPSGSRVLVDIADWGHEWQCRDAAAVTPTLLARVLRQRAT